MGRQVKYFDHVIAELADASGLSPRRAQVLELLARGYTSKEIADELGIGEDCAKAHIDHLRNQFCAMNRVELVCQAWAHGVLKASARAVYCLFGTFSATVKAPPSTELEHHFHRAQARLRTRKGVGIKAQKSAVAPLFREPTTGDSGYYEIPACYRKRMARLDLDNVSRLAAYADRVQAHLHREADAA